MPAPLVQCASFLSGLPNTREAIEEACGVIEAELAGRRPTLVAVFCSLHHGRELDGLPRTIAERLGTDHLVGCSGDGIIGRNREVEDGPALSVWAAHIPALLANPFHLRFEPRGDALAVHGWPAPVDLRGRRPTVLMFADGFSSIPQLVIDQFAAHYPGMPLVGGLAGGGQRAGQNRLFLGRTAHAEGVVGLLLWGPARLQAVVSQGCRPVGRPWVITRAQEHAIVELGGQPALARLQQVYADLAEHEPTLAPSALQLGCVINEHRPSYGRGDFLVRPIAGIDPQSGAIGVSEGVRVGQTVQFHLRDAGTAREDLSALLGEVGEQHPDELAGALLFSCNGRGTRLFGVPDHDARLVAQHLGPLALGGFFAQGEIGPVGGRNFLHGFTASLMLVHRSGQEQRP